MREMLDVAAVQTGWDVFDSGGAHLGTVAEVSGNYLLVQKGIIFVHDIYVPVSAVSRVESGAVHVSASKAEIEAGGWDQPPADTMDAGYGRPSGAAAYDREPVMRDRDPAWSGDRDEHGAEALGAGGGALGGAAVGGAIAGPPGAVVGGVAGAAAGAAAGEAAEDDDEAGSAAGGAGGTLAGAAVGGAVAGPPGAVVGGAVGAGAGAGVGDKAEEEAKREDEYLDDGTR